MESSQVLETALETQDDDVLVGQPTNDGDGGDSKKDSATPVSMEPSGDVGNVGKSSETEGPELHLHPVATPCRAPAPAVQLDATPSPPVTPTVLEVSSPGSISGIDDNTVSKPDPRALRISEAAADARLRRVFQPSLRTGQYKVSDAALAQYRKNGKGRKSLMKLFETCGYDKDRVSKFEVSLGVSRCSFQNIKDKTLYSLQYI